MRCAVVGLGLLLLGCAAKNPYLGDWSSHVTVKGFEVNVVHHFREQGSYSADLETSGVRGTLAGTYTYEADKLTITPTTFNLDTGNAGLLGQMAEQFKPQVEAELKKPQSGTVTWANGSFTVKPSTAGAPTIEFKKQEPKG